MNLEKKIILNHNEIAHKIKRMAYQIYESNVNESEIIIAGIANNGFILAEQIVKVFKEISSINCLLCKVEVNKQQPTEPVKISINKEDYTNKSIVLIDDVLNSGSTLIYGIKHFLEVPVKQFKTAVLVNRNHKKYPVKADFKGISLSTSLYEHVHVNLNGPEFSAYLEE